MQYRGMPFLVLLVILLSAIAVNGNVSAMRYQNLLALEQSKRLGNEQALQDATVAVDRLRRELQAQQDKMNGIESILNQGNSKAATLERALLTVQEEKKALQNQLQMMQQKMQNPPPAAAAESGQ